MLLLLSAIWGSAFYFIKIGVSFHDPITVASLRLIIAAIFLYIFFKFNNYKFEFNFKIIFLIFIIGVIGNFIPFFLISWAEQSIQSNTAGLLLSVAPILALILSHFFTKEDKFTYRKFFAIIIGLIGVIFILDLDLKNFFNPTLNNSENFLPKVAVIISAFGYVISSILAFKIKNINIVSLTTFVTIFAALISLPFLIFYQSNNFTLNSFNSFYPLLYLGLFPTAIAFLLRFYLISKAGPIFLSYVAYLIPVFAIIWGYIFLKETISFNIFLGVCFVLAGVYIGRQFNDINS